MMFRENWKELSMSATASTALSPVALHKDEGEALWFLGVLATIKASSETTDGRVAVIEHLAPQGARSPLHVHHNEDEWFYVTEAELSFWVGGRLIDTLLITAIRHWLDLQTDGEVPSWLRALRDPVLARVVAVLHARPAEPWTVEALAREVHISRATLARRFAEVVGEPPLTSLTRW